jgi:Na+/H+ antiporter NhaC
MSIRMSNFYFFLLIVVVVVFFFLKKNYFPGMFACGFCKTASVLDVWEKIHL